MQKKWILALVLSLIILTAGCAVPAIPFLDNAPAAQNPAPTDIDDGTLATLVAEAAAQKVAQTLEAMPPTPAPTATVPQTPQPTATIPPTATITPTPYPEKGSELISDGDAYTYYDYNTGYRITTPVNWLAIRPGEVEYAEAWGLPVASFAEVNVVLQSMQSLDPNAYRLYVLDTQQGHFGTGYLTKAYLYSTPTDGATLDEYFAQTVLELPNTTSSLVVTNSYLDENGAGLRRGVIISVWDAQRIGGDTTSIYQKQVIYQVNDAFLVFTLTSRGDAADIVFADFDQMVASLTPLE